MAQLNVAENLSEIIEYDTPYLPIRTRRSKLSYFYNRSASCHWHIDLEFIYVLDGSMNYFVDGENYTLQKGEGIFVNSNRLHYGYGHKEEDCDFLVLLLSPQLLVRNSHIENKYIRPLLQDHLSNAIVFREEIVWQKEALDYIRKLYELCHAQVEGYELLALSQFELLFLLLYQNTVGYHGLHQEYSRDMNALKNMLGYIQSHFAENISLQEIAAAGSVGRSKCCTLFRNSLKKSPIEYLASYRIQKSVDFMTNDSLNMTEISAACGFNSSSYFAETFKKIWGVSPTEYRKTITSN
ncbi:AraC family transcriptional regulator [Paenibacillus sp. 79R4]|uniref:helix-turn-helix transcriptional regulator n=1 Tax=Paenibacillus sp. 79R4 TaxID=2212847 RepID=UPI0015BE294C|nr:AraC family transcriptional regulator [Paenibacillus sp. 79R4]NWL88061.1 AraC family transcriptional regulator [Paenibacillus sp. 79R4]